MSQTRSTTADGRPRVDAIEEQMIRLLQRDGRLPAATLSRLLDVNPLTVRRKLKRLVDSGLISIVAKVDPFDLGYETSAIIGLKVDRTRIAEIADALSALPMVRYVGASAGAMDLFIELVTKSNLELASFILEDLAAIPGITDSQTSVMVRVYKQSWDWHVPQTSPARKGVRVRLDDADEPIDAQVGREARPPTRSHANGRDQGRAAQRSKRPPSQRS